jgi:hypothetical protein
MSMRSFEFESAGASRARSLRASEDPGVLVGYSDGAKGRAWPGDGQFPFVKDPPDVSLPLRYLKSQVLTATTTVTDFVRGDTLDVRGVSTLVVYVRVDPNNSDGRLAIVPEAQLIGNDAPSDVAFPVAVVDVTLTTPPTGLVDSGYASRNLLQTFLTWDPGAEQSPAPTLDGNFQTVFQLDVSSYQALRLAFGALDANVAAQAWVAAQR